MSAGGDAGEAARRDRERYEHLNYPALSYNQTSPDLLGTVGSLLGLQPAFPAEARVLDIGCAGGGNLLPLAVAYPAASFTGIDYAASQVLEARQTARELGLTNVRFEQVDIREAGAEVGQFDYVLAHGIYSWVPAPIRDALLALVGRVLAPQGVAYLSFNCMPGFAQLRVIRDAMLFHAGAIDDPIARAREGARFIDFLARSNLDPNDAYAAMLQAYAGDRDERGDIGGETPLAFLAHDELSEVNEGFYFSEVAAHAAAHCLQFLADTDPPREQLKHVAPEAVEEIGRMAGDIVQAEQYLDFVVNRGFRRVLFCRQEAALRRPIAPEPSRFSRLHALSLAEPLAAVDPRDDSVARFRGSGEAEIASNHPAGKAALLLLSEAPGPVPVPALLDAAVDMAAMPCSREEAEAGALATLLQAYAFAASLVSFHLGRADFGKTPGERPRASPYARFLAAQDRLLVTNLRHERVVLTPFACVLLTLLDGRRDRAALLAELAPVAPPPRSEREAALSPAERLEAGLQVITRAALLMPGGA